MAELMGSAGRTPEEGNARLDQPVQGARDGEFVMDFPEQTQPIDMKTELRKLIREGVGADYRPTAAQETMKQDIGQANRQPVRAGSVLGELFGPGADLPVEPLMQAQITEMALAEIRSMPGKLRLGIKEWQQVQNLIERGILAGWERGRSSRR